MNYRLARPRETQCPTCQGDGTVGSTRYFGPYEAPETPTCPECCGWGTVPTQRLWGLINRYHMPRAKALRLTA